MGIETAWASGTSRRAELRLLPDLAGRDAVELGCGTAYVSSWLARRGARVVGLDNSPAQLRSARTFQHEFGLTFPLIHGDAEHAPLRDARLRLRHQRVRRRHLVRPLPLDPRGGAAAAPGRATRLPGQRHPPDALRPRRGRLPAGDRLLRDYFGMHRFTWPDDSVDFHLGYGDWIRLLRRNGFAIEDLIELRAPEGAASRFPWISADWGRRWPTEEVWVARRLD